MTNAVREYNHTRLTQAMAAQGLDAVVASSPWNVSYLSGLSIDFSLLTFLVTTRDGRQGLVINEADAFFLRHDSTIPDIRDYPYSDTTAVAAQRSVERLAELLRDMGLAGARLGVDAEFLPARFRDALEEFVPDATLDNGSPALNEARIHKTPAELAIIRRAAYYTDKAIHTGFALARPGDTERDVANAIQSATLRYGATTLAHTVCSAGVQSTVVHAHPLDKPIVAGDVIHVDFGGRFEGYQTDLSRNAVVGDPNPRQRAIYQHLWDIEQLIFANMRPGVVARDLFRLAEEAFERAGLRYPWGTLGHSTGLLVHEGFEITRTSERVIEAGMVLNIEPTHIEPGDARYHIEDTVLVTERGVEVLSNYSDPRQMYVIR
ncbi:MAG TPA: Xaa-Pro peptidase family protein [Thermomicrobiaceae bacterium]|nr:Xaa-Pro peptidase family protein [Thermomicrobiaceae bacterium]